MTFQKCGFNRTFFFFLGMLNTIKCQQINAKNNNTKKQVLALIKKIDYFFENKSKNINKKFFQN